MPESSASDWPVFIQTPLFQRKCERFGLTDTDVRALEGEILKTRSRQPVIPGSGGARKMRFAPRGEGRGKRGAYRVIVGDFPQFGRILLVDIFDKTEQADLTSDDKKALRALMTATQERFMKETGGADDEQE
jgi:hypothetical protein